MQWLTSEREKQIFNTAVQTVAVSFLICIASWLYRVSARSSAELSLAFHLWSAITRSSCRLSPRRAMCCPLEASRPTQRGGTQAFGNRALWFSERRTASAFCGFGAAGVQNFRRRLRPRPPPVSVLLGALLRGGHSNLVPSAVRKWLGEPCRGPHPPRDDPGCRYAGVSFAPARPQQQPLPLLTATPRGGGGGLLCRQIFLTLTLPSSTIRLSYSLFGGAYMLSRF